ncbi:MAG: trigger factor [Ruminococcus sp.]|nr:trigger factor [Ruminococcus sp.]MBQ8906163.1 trigger factor [Ruminococcus sp.]
MSLKSSEKIDVNTQELLFEIDAETFENAVEAVYQKQRKNIQIQGFRKGKASRKMVEKVYGEGVFYEEAINSLLGGELAAAIEETKLELVDRPTVEVTSINKETGITIKATCITKPDVTLPEYKGIKAPKRVTEVTEEAIDKQVEVLLQRNARMISVDDRPVANGDEATIDFEGFLDGVAFDGGKGEGFPLKIGGGQFIPGFEEQIIGHSIGEEFDINVTFPEDYQMTDLAGKETVFKIKIHAITCQELPEFDDEFVKDTSEFDTVAEFRADMKAKMTENAENAATSNFENSVFETLIKNTEAVIPPVMIEHRIDALVDGFAQSLQQQGMTLDIYLQYTGMTENAFRDTFDERARNEVILRLALEKIANQEGFEITEEEINAGLEPLSVQSGLTIDQVKQRIPMSEFITDLKVTKAAELVKESAVVDNTIEETTEETAE